MSHIIPVLHGEYVHLLCAALSPPLTNVTLLNGDMSRALLVDLCREIRQGFLAAHTVD